MPMKTVSRLCLTVWLSLGPCLLIGTLDVIHYGASKPQIVTDKLASQLTVISSTGYILTSPPLLASGKHKTAAPCCVLMDRALSPMQSPHKANLIRAQTMVSPHIVPPNSFSLTLANPNPSSTNVIGCGVTGCDTLSSDASPLLPETSLPSVPSRPLPSSNNQPKKSFGYIHTK
ncbi:hypothetical protein RSAG8_00906, partial [Rhizoctonia solani AG-8 WAC10335]